MDYITINNYTVIKTLKKYWLDFHGSIIEFNSIRQIKKYIKELEVIK